MKTQNTLENKAKFFALYWLQEVLCSDIFHYKNKKMNGNNIPSDHYLELKPLSQISDEDALMLGYADSKSATTTYFGTIGKYAIEVDYLRSKGYALPYMDLSVEDLVEYGWVKLKEN